MSKPGSEEARPLLVAPYDVPETFAAPIDDGDGLDHRSDTSPKQRTVPRPRGWGKRYTLVVLMTACNACLYLSRVNISVAVIKMAKEFNWDATTQGRILSGFYWGYLMTQPLGGWVAGRIGGKYVLAGAVAVWSVVTLLTSTVSASGHVAALIIARVVVGAAEGVNYPCQAALADRWIPPSELSRAWSIGTTGENMGTILALLAGPPLADRIGWAAIFYSTGAAGVLWLLCFLPLASSEPEQHSGVSKEELAYIQASRPKDTTGKGAPVPWRSIATNPAFLLLILQHCCYNMGNYIWLSWMPSFFEHTLHVKFADLGLPTVMPYASLWLISTSAGVFADWLIGRGWKKANVRKLCNTIGMCGPAACLMLLRNAKTLVTATVLLSLAIGLGGFALAGYWANFVDIGGKHAGLITGISNSIATIPGIVGNIVTGALLTTFHNDYNPILELVAGIQVFGALVFALSARGTPQFQ